MYEFALVCVRLPHDRGSPARQRHDGLDAKRPVVADDGTAEVERGRGARIEEVFSGAQQTPPGGGSRRRSTRTGTGPQSVGGKRLKQAPRSTWRPRRYGPSLRWAPGTLSCQARRRFQTGWRNLQSGGCHHGGARGGLQRGGDGPARPDPDRRGHGRGLFRRSGGPVLAHRLAEKGCTGRRLRATEVRRMPGGLRPRPLERASVLQGSDARVEP
jgi:hypothetical protein